MRLPNPITFALAEAVKSINRMAQRFPAVTFNHDALWSAFDCARLEVQRRDALLRQAFEALESCGQGAEEDGGMQWFDKRAVDDAYDALEKELKR